MSTRADLKENVLATKVEAGLKWILENRGPVLTVSGVVIVALLAGSVFVLRNREKSNTDNTRLAVANSLLSARQYDRAEPMLADIRASITDNDLSARTAYYQGLAALGLRKFDDAEKFFSESVNLSPGKPLNPLALSNLGFAQEQKKDYDAASQTFTKFMSQYGEHFLAPRVQLMLGRTLAAAGKTDDARKALGHLIDLYPTSHWAENARSIMDKFKTR